MADAPELKLIHPSPAESGLRGGEGETSARGGDH